jgi:hypothetical protein
MKKYIMVLLLLPTLLRADVIKDYQKEYSYLNKFKVESSIKFKIRAGHEYTFKVLLRQHTQYCFMAQGDKDFHFQIIENSGITASGWEGLFSRNSRVIALENIQYVQTYTIKVYSFTDNYIQMYWGEY